MKVTLVIPANSLSGGPESLYQLGEVLKKQGIEVVVKFVYGEQAPEKFKKYHLKSVEKISDTSDNVVIVPEIFTYFFNDLRNVKKVVWWLSVDNYFKSLPENIIDEKIKLKSQPHWYKLLYLVKYKHSEKMKNRFNYYKFDNSEVFHLYNAEYVKQFLIKNGVLKENCFFLTPPVSDEYFNIDIDTNKKENIVAYNPLKGFEFLKKVQENSELEFVPIQNMTNQQVVSLLKKAKVYIDLGEFPGPDRIPRQAVLCGCNLLTSTEGAADNDFDTPIPSLYKINRDDTDRIVNQLNVLVDNYEKEYLNFDKFRSVITEQKVNFNQNCVDTISSIYKLN